MLLGLERTSGETGSVERGVFYVLVSWLFLELESKEHLANSVGVLSVLEYSMWTVNRTDMTAFQHSLS